MSNLAPIFENHSDSTPSIDLSGNNLAQLEAFLRARYRFRYNIVSHKSEFIKNNAHAKFVDMTDFDYNSVLRDIHKSNIKCPVELLRRELISDFVPFYDPYIEFRKSLPQWDGVTDHIGAIASTVSTHNDEFWTFSFRKWFVAAALSWIESEVVNHTAIIFTGAQGIGKTTWLRSLVPNALKRYIFSGKINLSDKDSQIKLSECCLIIMDELENMSATNIESLKELITKKDIYLRRAYGYTHEKYVRRASLVGSTNNPDFLHDMTGNRRFLCFNTTEFRVIDPQIIEQAYAQAYTLADQGFLHWFNEQEIAQVELNNESFRVVVPEAEVLETYYEATTSDQNGVVFMKTTDILSSLTDMSKHKGLSSQKLGRVLHARGYKRIKRNGVYGYLLKLKTP